MKLPAEDRELLIGLLRDLTPGALSTLVAALREPNSRIGTSIGSKNYVFLQKLCELGLAKEVPLEVDMPPELQAVLRSVLIDEAAKPEIADLVEQLSINPDRAP